MCPPSSSYSYTITLLTLTGTEQSLWDAVLDNVKVVVSTYQILLDALSHAFVRMESLALIVFDEGEPLPAFPQNNTKVHKPTTALADTLAQGSCGASTTRGSRKA
jgi:hypothetical protein